MFVYYSHSIWMRTLYLHFICIICVWYLNYSLHKTQTLLLPNLMAGPWVDLGFLTGVGTVPDCFSFIFLLSHSSFSLHLCSSTASCIFNCLRCCKKKSYSLVKIFKLRDEQFSLVDTLTYSKVH